ncbi:response regulator [Azospirillum sp. CT11-132]|jgi:DNA-binding NarL/FixJ family response regulator|uniref:Response regulator transcription factor n=1 Tax=Azospirillum oryzae TaxID=286727 RepID=A0A6N1AEP9_9PROT|nr:MULTISPECIES: response regulator transcription factor [Azospirillum]KAA0573621.1 response regulator transcription factor [Azospirillum sp. Sh1]KAA0588133.1 response regulator transcription factor [Azospirillum oryzae]PWC59636.1 transcriptional regulator [Azospirillum sp. TSH20]PWC65696.1 transcriptional regulator [Azospirillum sp. TSH7]QCG95244.1 response regulator transcription factor [Azospirillum sp. TSA2s]
MKILIGDDHVLFREGLRRLLEQLRDNATFAEASNFDELLDMAASKDEAYDLVLTDLRMPGWPGFSGIGMLRERQPNAKVVVVSASEAQADVREALENGAAGYIPKSSSVKIMLSALDLIFSGGVYVPATVLREGTEPDHRGAGGVIPPTDPQLEQLLTQRQREVLDRLREGKSNKQIAHELGLSEGTVKIHMTAIFKSLGVRNRTQAAMAFPQSHSA